GGGGVVGWVKLRPDAVLWPMLLLGTATVVLLIAVPVVQAVAGRSPRMPWLDAPFDGSPQVAVLFTPSLSTNLLGEVASLYGYFHGGPAGTGRNNESFLFAKCRPGLVFGTPA